MCALCLTCVACCTACCAQTPNSIGYEWLDQGADSGLSPAQLINAAGQAIEANVASVRIGLMENAASKLLMNGATLDVTGSVASGAWPINGLSFLLMRGHAVRETCAIRTATAEFFRWCVLGASLSVLLGSSSLA